MSESRLFWLACAVLLYAPFIDTRIDQGNVASDLAAIESLVERGGFYINDSTFADTIDKFKFEDHWFSQKSPIFHLVGATVYAPFHWAGITLRERPAPVLRALVLVLVIAPMGWALSLLFNHPWARERSLTFRWLFTLAFALGTPLTTFAITLNHYTAAAAFLLAASVEVLGIVLENFTAARCGSASGMQPQGGDPSSAQGGAERNSESTPPIFAGPERATLRWPGASPRLPSFFRLGFFISASLACDVPPAFIFGAGVIVWMLWRIIMKVPDRKKAARNIALIALGAAPLLALYAGLNIRILGSPFPPNMHESEMLYVEGSYWAEQREAAERGEPGYYQASYPRRLFHATLGHKGIYWMTPALAVATILALALARRRAPAAGWALAWAAFPPVAVAVTMIWAFDLSGGAYGVRHVFATLPPLFSVLAHPSLVWTRGRALAMAPAALFGAAVAWIGVINPWSHNTLSAYPPLENLARHSLAHSGPGGAAWIEPLIENTSVTQPVAWLDLGLERMGRGEWDQAERALARAVTADPRKPLPLYHLGIAQDRRNRPDRAIETYTRLLEIEPQNLGAWNNMGLFALRAGRDDLARRAYTRSLELAPDNASGLWGMMILEDLAAPGAGEKFRARGAKLYPSDPRFETR